MAEDEGPAPEAVAATPGADPGTGDGLPEQLTDTAQACIQELKMRSDDIVAQVTRFRGAPGWSLEAEAGGRLLVASADRPGDRGSDHAAGRHQGESRRKAERVRVRCLESTSVCFTSHARSPFQ